MLSLLRWLSRRPLWLLHLAGGALGWFTFLVAPAYRRRFIANARQAGVPARAWRPAVAQAGRLLMELPLLWLRPAGVPLQPAVAWDNAPLITEALARGRGVVFLTPHMGSFEVTAQAFAERFAPEFGPITVLYRPARKAWVRRAMDASRTRANLATAPASLAGVRQMLRALKRGEAIGLLPDQVPPEGLGVWVPFFGRPAYTMTLAARLVQQTGAVPLLAWGERLARGAGFVVHVEAFGEALPRGGSGGDQAESATAVNRAMERLILQRPQQYLWGYQRYKSPRSSGSSSSPG